MPEDQTYTQDEVEKLLNDREQEIVVREKYANACIWALRGMQAIGTPEIYVAAFLEANPWLPRVLAPMRDQQPHEKTETTGKVPQ